MNSSFHYSYSDSPHRPTFEEKLSKTIAMIHASPSYQRFLQRRKDARYRKMMHEDGSCGRNFQNLKQGQKECELCFAFLRRRSNSGFCTPCLKKELATSFKSGLSIDQCMKKYRVGFEHINGIINGKGKSKKVAKPKDWLLNQAESIANSAFQQKRKVISERIPILA